jgi:hypothetical protein
MANQYLQPFFDTLSQGVQVAEHLRQAALQQQQLDQARQAQEAAQAQRQQEIEQRNRQLDLSSQLQQANLIERGARPAQNGRVSMPMSTPTDTGGIVPGAPAFAPSGATSVPVDQGRTIAIGGQQYEIPNADELNQRNLSERLAQYNIGKVPLSEEGSKALGGVLPPGTLVDPEHMAGAGSMMRAYGALNRPTAERPLHFTQAYDTHGNLTMIGTDPQTGEIVSQKTVKGVGTPRDQVTENQTRLLNQQQRQQDMEDTYGNLLAESGGDPKKAMANLKKYATADKTNKYRQYFGTLYTRLHGAIGKPSETDQIMEMLQGGDGGQAAQQPAQAIPQPAAPIQAPAPKPQKVASVSSVKAYAKRKGVSLDQATREFTQYGYRVQ